MNSEKSSKANLINGANYHHRMDSIHRNISFDLLRVVNQSFERQILNLDPPKQNFETKNVSFLKCSAHKWRDVLYSVGRLQYFGLYCIVGCWTFSIVTIVCNLFSPDLLVRYSHIFTNLTAYCPGTSMRKAR